MLIRLCGDWKLARSVWENVIRFVYFIFIAHSLSHKLVLSRPNIRDATNKPGSYPWTIMNDEKIGKLQ